ncbi:MAG: hypothetical protein M1831_003578 [Alyxoria varia]|nr:MAG: hypothetical protein M1831_003578 [Alyxoria varia]
MAANPAQLFLLSDHVKLSLLERQRAVSLNLEPNSQNSEISRSLESLRDGVEVLEAQQRADPATSTQTQDQTSQLRQQHNDLYSQFHGDTSQSRTSPTLTQPNDPSLSSDFSHAQQDTRPSRSTRNKSVRFSDDPSDEAEAANRAALMPAPYRDNPEDPTGGGSYRDSSGANDEDAAPDHTHLDNQQIHEYHSQVLRDQDDQLDSLGESIRRQHTLSMQIGDELEEQAQILDDTDEGVERHQTQLDRARDRVGKIARKAKDNMSMTVILILIVILVLLIVILKT